MHAPSTLIAVSAVLGVLVPFGIHLGTTAMDNTVVVLMLKIVSLAVVPAITARAAYRQGYDAAVLTRRSPAE